MGKRLCDLMSAAGAFTWIGANASLCWRTKLKQRKPIGSKEVNEEDQSKRGKSQGRWKPRYKSKVLVQRGKSSNQRKGAKSQSRVPRRRSTNLGFVIDAFKNACISCQSSLLHQMCQRGKSKECHAQNCQEIHPDECARGRPTKRIHRSLLDFLTGAAAVQRFMLERAVAAIIQMLLVRSGIETNPGPTTPAVRYH